MAQQVLSAKGISVNFGPLKALDGISLDFLAGEVHAVVGENGAGKSTLMNVLAGFLAPSSGVVSLGGRRLLNNAVDHRNCGIEMVHQHFRLVPAFSVKENLRLGLMRAERTFEDVQKVAAELDWDIEFDSLVSDLGVGQKQRVEILKALASSPKVVIFDEPTAVLNEDEVSGLLRSIREFAQNGLVVILIAHKLAELFSVADRISVLKDGTLRGSFRTQDVSSGEISELMVGSPDSFPEPVRFDNSSKFSCRNLRVDGNCPLVNLNFDVAFGEVLGIGGVDGNGQVELAEALAQVRTSEGETTAVATIGYVPQDRQADGLALSMSIDENIEIAQVSLNGSTAIKEYEIKARSPKALLKSLSGGNQQKVVLARELAKRPELLVAVNPTRGLDVRASSFVLNQIRNIAEQGAAVVLISTDRDELAAVANRTIYLSRGRLLNSAQEALSA
jgi:simple sugar transport system ATP-binding protein